LLINTHKWPQVAVSGFDQQVIVIAHQYPMINLYAKTRLVFSGQFNKALVIGVIEKDILPVHSAIHNVIANGTLKNSGCSGHSCILLP